MKNKKLLLVGVAAMGLVAAATAGVGTAAWYKVSQATINTLATDSKATISTYQDDFGVGAFTVTPVLGSVETAVDYTDSTGHTYYYLADGTTKIDAGMADVPSAQSSINITISIPKGNFASGTEVLAAWNGARGDDTHVRVTLTPTAPVKIATTAAGAYAATPGNAITIDFAVNALTASSFVLTGDTNYVYTASAANWHYAVEGANEVQTGLTAGTVGAGVAMYHN